jgi:hypothetical protein
MSEGNLEKFRSWLSSYTGPALASRFEVVIFPKFQFSDIGNISDFTFQCDSAEIPGKSLTTFDARTYGPSLKFPYQTVYNDLTLTFICMGNRALSAGPNIPSKSDGINGLWEREFFERWMYKINPPTTNLNYNYNLQYKDEYTGTINITHFDTDEDKLDRVRDGGTKFTKTVEIQDAYPIAINPITLNWADESIMRLSVTFTYRQYIGITAPPATPRPPLSTGPLDTIVETTLPGSTIFGQSIPGGQTRISPVYPLPGTEE